MIGQVQELNRSAGGKPKAKIAGVWYFLPTDRDTGQGDSPLVNQSVEYDIGESFTMGDKTFQTISRWRPAGQSQPVQTQSAPRASQSPPQRQAPLPTAATYIDEASLRFISNVIGQAIAAKTITTPGQILAWVTSAKLALEGKASATPYSDPLPPREPEEPQPDYHDDWGNRD